MSQIYSSIFYEGFHLDDKKWERKAVQICVLLPYYDSLKVELYQRGGKKWSNEKKKIFIQSIIENKIIPEIYLEYLTETIIDGQQRLETLFDFVYNNVEYGNLSFNSLPVHIKKQLNTYKLNIAICNESSYDERLKMFKNLNSGTSFKIHELNFLDSETPLYKSVNTIIEWCNETNNNINLLLPRGKDYETLGREKQIHNIDENRNHIECHKNQFTVLFPWIDFLLNGNYNAHKSFHKYNELEKACEYSHEKISVAKKKFDYLLNLLAEIYCETNKKNFKEIIKFTAMGSILCHLIYTYTTKTEENFNIRNKIKKYMLWLCSNNNNIKIFTNNILNGKPNVAISKNLIINRFNTIQSHIEELNLQ
jgi:hypothetical protein